MNYVDKVIEIAKAEIGYCEKASNKDLDNKTANAGTKNYTKYARDIDAISNFYNGKKNGFDWCDVFVDWCFVKAYGVDEAKKLLCQPDKSCGAGCGFSMRYYEAKGQLVKEPAIGDQIFFKKSSGDIYHTGLVVAVDNTYVYTVEGNTSGGKVANCKYKKTSSSIAGYGRPKYDIKIVETNKVESDVINVGDLVQFNGTTHYAHADALFGKKCTKGLARVTQTYNGKHPYHLVGTTSNVYGWVNAADVTKYKAESYQCIHTVKKGETLWVLAEKYLGNGTKYTEIMKLNGKKKEVIYVGEKLKIPNK